MTALVSIIGSLVIIPAAYMCYLPMRNQLRFSKKRVMRDCGILFVLSVVAMIGMEHLFKGASNTLLFVPFLIIFCLYYIYSTRASISQNLGIFCAVCALAAVASELAYILYVICFQQDATSDNNLIVNLIQLGFVVLLVCMFYRPLKQNGVYMVDNLRIDWIWICTIPVSVIVFVTLVLAVPMIFKMDDEPGLYVRILVVVLLAIGLYLFQLNVFAHMCKVLMSEDQLKAQETVFKIQRKQYETMERSLEENKIVRHDTKHSMQLARRLLQEGKAEELGRYLDVYIENMPTDTVHRYCSDGIINAVLNYIADSCDDSEVQLELFVDIPTLEEHQSVDVASFLQNLGENAVLGCETVPPRDRRFTLTLKVVHGKELFIVSTNTFNGEVRKEDSGFLTTRAEDGGSGLGIPSMRAITAKYGGTLEVSNTDTRFFVNARMNLVRRR